MIINELFGNSEDFSNGEFEIEEVTADEY